MKRRIIGLVIFLVLLLTAAAVIIYKHQTKEADKMQAISHAIPADSTDFYWFKNCVMYNVDVEVFKDSDGDGTGDFKGLTEALPYFDSLGVNVVWLAPFQPTPNRDDGYDITDYYTVDKRLGTIEDFQNFVSEAGKHHIRVIMDLVLNHTSDQHPWFQQARKDTNSPYHSWYSWSEERPKNWDIGMAFPGVQKAIWTYDSVAKEYYYHRFYDFEPDLNTQNPDVQVECLKIIKFWMDKGLSGFREDAVPFFVEVPAKKGDRFEHQFGLIAQMHNYLKTLKPDAIILGEANVLPQENVDFFGHNKEGLQMMLNFYANQFMFYGLATGNADKLIYALKLTGQYPRQAQWGQFLRNHDEVDLGRLSKKEREEVYKKFGPDKSMQLYDRGIRRRLAPMLGNNRKYMEMAYSLMYSLPSTPIIRYGEEIGMGDDLTLQERLSVRTPMQWSAGPGAGFSTAAKTVRPIIDTGTYRYQVVNVETEKANPQSLLNWMSRMIKLRKDCPEIGFGDWHIIDLPSKHVVAIYYEWQGKKLVLVNNLDQQAQSLTLSAKEAGGNYLHDLLGKEVSTAGGDGEHHLQLEGWGYRWYRVENR